MSLFERCVLLGAVLAAAGCGTAPAPRSQGQTLRMAMMPKITGIAYFNACEKGAREAAAELGIDFTYDGPADNKVEEQIRILEQWIAQGYDCIAVAPNHPALISPVLEQARAQGITVLTFDADADRGRQFFINQATYEDIARALVDTVAEEIGGKGKVAILTSTLQAPNQSQWARRMKAYRAEKYPDIVLLDEVESQESSTIGFEKSKDLIQAHPDLKGIVGLTSIAFPAAAEAVEKQGKQGHIAVVGLSTPREMRSYVNRGTVKTVILWRPVDLGYLTVQVAHLLHKGQMKEQGKISAGRLGEIEVRAGGEVVLGPPMRFTKENINDPENDF